MKIQLDSGEKLEVPDGSTPEQVDEAVNHFMASKQSQIESANPVQTEKSMLQAMGDRTLSQNAGDVWEGIKSGAVPFSDEIQAGIAAATASPFVNEPFSELYKQAKYGTDMVQGTLQRQQEAEQNPLAYYPAMVGGALATGIGASGRATQTTPQLAEFAAKSPKLAAAGSGAVQGGLYGAGAGEGTAKDIASQAGSSALGGAIAAPLAVVANQRIFSPLLDKAKRIFSKTTVQSANNLPLPELLSKIESEKAVQGLTYQGAISEGRAMDKITQAIQKDFPDNFEQVLNAWKQSGQPLANLYSPQVTSLAKGAAQYPSGQKAATEYFDTATIEAQQKMAAAIPAVDNFYSTVDDIVSKGQAKARPFYERAYKAEIAPPKDGFAPEVQSAINAAKRKYPSELNGYPDNSIKVLDYAKRVLDDAINKAQRAGEGNFARDRTGIKNNLLKQMDDASPEYALARAKSSDYLSVSKAMDDGRDFMKVEPDLIAKNISKMSEAEKEAYKSGVATQLKETILKKTEGANPYNSIMGSPTQQKRLMKIFSPTEYNKIKLDLDAENKLFKMRNEVLAGSPTTSKAIAAGMIADGGEAMLSGLASGKPSTMGVIKSVISKSFDGLNDKTAGEVSKLIYETDPVKKLQMLQKIGGNKMLNQAEKQQVKSVYFKAMEQIGKKQLATGGATGAIISETVKPEPLRITVTPQDRKQ